MSTAAPAHNERDGLQPPSKGAREARSFSNSSVGTYTKAAPGSFAPSFAPPGSFNPDPKSTIIHRTDQNRPDPGIIASYRPPRFHDGDDRDTTEQRVADYKDKIEKETKIKIGSENMLEALNAKNPKQTRDQRVRVEMELYQTNRKIAQLKSDLEVEIQRSKLEKDKSPSPAGRLSQLFRHAHTRSPSRLDFEEEDEGEDKFDTETESPTFILAEILQSLEAEALPSEYYVERANNLVELFKRHPTLKYDLAWSIFGLRMQVLLLSESREVVAAGYRLMRYAITDRRSLEIMRSLQTDYLVMLSLVKESKASVEREQALKFVRAFLDVKGGADEISRGIVRVLVAIAEHHDDRMRNICILTLAEIMVRNPSLVVSAGGIGVLSDALADGNFKSSESLTAAFLHIEDMPNSRKYLKSGQELTGAFSAFTNIATASHEEKLKASAKVISSIMKSWPGLMSLSTNKFIAFRSLFASLYAPVPLVRDVVLELVLDILRIRPPAWSSSFLAGRRLTTYGRVTNLNAEDQKSSSGNGRAKREELAEHFVAAILAAFLQAGLLEALLYIVQHETDTSIRRKATLLLGGMLNKANQVLPNTWAMKIQVLPQLFTGATYFHSEERYLGSSAIYQIDSVNRTLYRSGQALLAFSGEFGSSSSASLRRPADVAKDTLTPQIDEGQFRAVMMETQVLNTVNFVKWRWDLIEKIVDGPLLNPKRLEEATKATKFVKRLIGFYRPFKFRFADIRNTKPNQRYVRIGRSLIRTLLATNEGIRYLVEDKLLRQLAECLAQFDRMSGLISESPLFSEERLSETLTSGYFGLLGELSKNNNGLVMMERWKMANMFYHIVELQGRDDLIKALLSNMDYTLDSHLRVVLSKALTACSSEVRIFSTRLLRKYATRYADEPENMRGDSGHVEWALQLLTTQLYDPEVEVCEAAIRILEEACDDPSALEFVVRCRPALDHLGEIGAPLLLRFLSTSTGYHYLDGLDYISQEMEDWFLGRNDNYVTLVEASLAKALSQPQGHASQGLDEIQEQPTWAVAPPHFYRELTRTEEGCKLLKSKGHFDDFVSVIKQSGLEDTDAETILKVKGCLWAVGNIGSMRLGAPFLENTDVAEKIIEIAETSEVMSMRGTAYFVLGLISRSIHGEEILATHGWDVAVDESGLSMGICLPVNFHNLFSITRSPALPPSTSPTNHPDAAPKPHLHEDDPLNARILALITDLGNTVLTKPRAAELNAIKAKKAPGFRSPALFHKVVALLALHHFRLPVLRFVIDLFDKRVMRRIVLDEEDEEEEGGREGGEESEEFESTVVPEMETGAALSAGQGGG